jgi:DnaD/phage-associated family protein
MTGRPIKQTVDFFPHRAVGGKTLYILESQFGNDGYAFWFRLLELLCVSEGHFYSCLNPADFQFLAAKTGLSAEKTELILKVLCDVEAIDPDLWTQHKVIWVQKLVNNFEGVYRQRRTTLPSKPIINNNNSISNTDKLISSDDKCQSLRKTRLDKTRLDKTRLDDDPLPPTPPPAVESSSSETLNNDLKTDGTIFQLYQQEIGELTAGISELLKEAEDEYPAEWITGAIKLAATHNKRNWSYVKGILENCKAEKHSPGDGKGKAPPGKSAPKDYTGGKYGHVVQR